MSSAPTPIVAAPPTELTRAVDRRHRAGRPDADRRPGQLAAGPTSVAYQWLACYDGSCQPEVGATSSSYRASALDTGFHLEVRVTVANAAGSATAYSAPTGAIAPAPPPAPAARPATAVTLTWTVAPQVSGTPTVGSTLTATTGLVEGLAAYAYQWQSCTAAGSCTDIPAAQGATFKPIAALVGSSLRVLVTATAGGAVSSDASNRTAAVAQTKGTGAGNAAVSRTRVALTTLPGVAAFIRGGLHASAHCAKACRVSLTLQASAHDGGLTGTIGSTSARLKAGQARTLTIVPSRRDSAALAALRTVHLRLHVRIVEAGATRSYTETVTIGR